MHEAWLTSCILAFFVLVAIGEYIIDRAALLHKLSTAFKEAEPASTSLVPPIPVALEQEQKTAFMVFQQIPEEERVFSKENDLVASARKKIVQSEAKSVTEEITGNNLNTLK